MNSNPRHAGTRHAAAPAAGGTRRRAGKAIGLFALAVAYLIVDLYVSVGIGSLTRNDTNEAFAFFGLLALGVFLLIKFSPRRRGYGAA